MKPLSALTPPAHDHPLAGLTLDTYRVLVNETDLSPNNPLINCTLHHFVQTVSGFHNQPDADAVLEQESIRSTLPRLYTLLSRAEGEMEKYYAVRYNGLDTVRLGELIQFLYWEIHACPRRNECVGASDARLAREEDRFCEKRPASVESLAAPSLHRIARRLLRFRSRCHLPLPPIHREMRPPRNHASNTILGGRSRLRGLLARLCGQSGRRERESLAAHSRHPTHRLRRRPLLRGGVPAAV